VTTVFFAFRDAPDRRAALGTPGSLDRYRLFGLDEIARRGPEVRHNLESDRPPRWARVASRAINAVLDATGGLGGDFASILASRRSMNTADVLFATVDTVGIPLVQTKRAGLVRPPVVYASIGLPERLERLRRERSFRRALQTASTIIAYSVMEANRLREWLGGGSPPVVFVPFGVDTEAFSPVSGHAVVDVVSIGADPRRDFELLLAVARRRPEFNFRIVATADRLRSLAPLPSNVAAESDLPLEAVRDLLAQARVVALPIRENSYSGATTTLLQGMAMGKPVVVSRTDAIADGYDLEDGINCRLVTPGDTDAFESALGELLSNANAADAMAARARETAVGFSWQRYTDRLWEILSAANGRGRRESARVRETNSARREPSA
jgi:glycosyltransferase involved in cell wall biosynthesis